MSDVICDVCESQAGFGDIAWMDKQGKVYCPDCRIGSVSKEYLVIEWPHEQGNSVLHSAKAMQLDRWR